VTEQRLEGGHALFDGVVVMDTIKKFS
jgi:hypothetical protein